MGMVIDGHWTENPPEETGTGGEFRRIPSVFRDRITADGSSGYPATAGRYHLYVGYHCPWAHRTIMFRVLKKLEHAISISYCLPYFRENGWTFDLRPECPDCTLDQINNFHYLYEAYIKADPHYTGKVTIPVLWDKETNKIINNESSEIIRMFNSEFVGIAGDDTDYYPEPLRKEIDAINDFIYTNVNNGVYRCGFARSQEAYDAAYTALFSALDQLEARLASRRYLLGDQQTEADWRLFPTLVRFDVAYFSIFKCNRQRMSDFPNLWRFTRDLYSTPGIAATVKPRIYVQNYYSIERVNPTGIIPCGTPVDFGVAASH
ncbi:MAG: glutathione S-transferase family protein [Xanthobacteraceae bacterium]|nr:glutathione S-transferase family protein [Xanthobacteraceae bacterium]MBV9630023.1 glutathione S-transferase family protein [Xanthobacteraceae bacterium]